MPYSSAKKGKYSKSCIRKKAETFTVIFGNERAWHQRGEGSTTEEDYWEIAKVQKESCLINEVPVNEKIANDEELSEACENCETDLLDILWLNHEALELALDLEEIGTDSELVTMEG